MKKHIKITLPIVAICAIAWLSSYEKKMPAQEATQITIDQNASSPAYQQSNSDEDTLVSSKEAENTHEKQETIHEIVVFHSTEEYESASRYGKLPSHMSDIALERFSVNSKGQLVVNENIKNIIEHFLTAAHVEGLDQTIARIHEYIELSLTGEAASQALAITNNYLLYKENLNSQRFAMSTDFSQQENLNMLKMALDDKKQIRREYLGETVSEALFGHEERYDDYSYQRLVINSNDSISEDEKDKLMAQAEQQLPPKMAAQMRYKREEKQLDTQISRLKSEAGSEQEIYQLREKFYGDKVAKRMAYLESTTPEWQARVRAFYQEQNSILNSSSLTNEEKRQAIKEAKLNSFTHKERIKLAVQGIGGV